ETLFRRAIHLIDSETGLRRPRRWHRFVRRKTRSVCATRRIVVRMRGTWGAWGDMIVCMFAVVVVRVVVRVAVRVAVFAIVGVRGVVPMPVIVTMTGVMRGVICRRRAGQTGRIRGVGHGNS
ncbi:hypothetical protein, partial [Pandoraea sp. B-6]|uniref:hypothetical protein n=1 Tax=Pandoraea sp. B-6 TaxID=1204340 RepID=UPI001E2981E7